MKLSADKYERQAGLDEASMQCFIYDEDGPHHDKLFCIVYGSPKTIKERVRRVLKLNNEGKA